MHSQCALCVHCVPGRGPAYNRGVLGCLQAVSKRFYRYMKRGFQGWPESTDVGAFVNLYLIYAAPWWVAAVADALAANGRHDAGGGAAWSSLAVWGRSPCPS